MTKKVGVKSRTKSSPVSNFSKPISSCLKTKNIIISKELFLKIIGYLLTKLGGFLDISPNVVENYQTDMYMS